MKSLPYVTGVCTFLQWHGADVRAWRRGVAGAPGVLPRRCGRHTIRLRPAHVSTKL